jgi:hypothetical protein
MAIIEGNLHITNIGNDVVLIENPSQDDEKILLRYDGSNRATLAPAIMELKRLRSLTKDQKLMTAFWMGYFWAHLSRGH